MKVGARRFKLERTAAERAQVQKDAYPKVRNFRVFRIVMLLLSVIGLSVAFISRLSLWGLGFIIGLSLAFYAWVISYLVNRPQQARQEMWQGHLHSYRVAQKNLYRFIAASEEFTLDQLAVQGEENQRRFERATSKLLKKTLELTRQENAIEAGIENHDPAVAEPLENYLREAGLLWHQWQHVKMNAAFWSGSSHCDEAIALLTEGLKEAHARFALIQHHIPAEARYFIDDRLGELSAAVRTVEQATDALQRKTNRAQNEQIMAELVDALHRGGETAEAILSQLDLLKRVYVLPPQKADGTLATLPATRTRLESSEYVHLRQGLYRVNATFAFMKPHPDYDYTRIDREISPVALRFNRFWSWWQRMREKKLVEQLGLFGVWSTGVLFTILVVALMDGDSHSGRYFSVGVGLAVVNATVSFYMMRHFSDRWAQSYIQSSIFRSTDRALSELRGRLSKAMLGLDDARLASLARLQAFEVEGRLPHVLTGDKRQTLREEALADAWREALELASLPQAGKDYRYIERVEELDARVATL